jgi:hypothetical protein
VAVLLSVVAAGCGGASNDSATASEPLTKAQFIHRATKICGSEDAEKERRLVAASKLGKNYLSSTSKVELTQLVDEVMLPFYEELIQELAALRPPAAAKDEVSQIVQMYEKTLVRAEADPEEMVTNDIFLKPNLVAIKFGIKNCTL